jgi:hypothetical protein
VGAATIVGRQANLSRLVCVAGSDQSNVDWNDIGVRRSSEPLESGERLLRRR